MKQYQKLPPEARSRRRWPAILAFVVVLACAVTGARTFNRIYTTAPVGGTGSSGSALTLTPDNDVGTYGDCSDGDVTITTNTSLARDMYYRNLTINASVTVKTASFAVYVCQTLTYVASDSLLSNSGNAGSVPGVFFGGVGGVTIPVGTLPGGGPGGSGGNTGSCALVDASIGSGGYATTLAPNRAATTTVTGGADLTTGSGGAGGGGSVLQGGGGGAAAGAIGCVGRGGGNSGANAIFPTAGDPREIFQGMAGQSYSGSPWDKTNGGGGGGGGNTNGGSCGGGGGGGGAGWMVVGARTIVGPGAIVAIGGNGGNGGPSVSGGGGGGGAGGSGGYVVVTTETHGITVSVAGGAGGSGGGSVPRGGNGGAGGPGLAVINYTRTL